MNYKLLAIDLDDTLLGEDYKISPRNLEALREVALMGIKITLATGRMFRSSLPYARQIGVELPIITYHGALIREITGEQRVLRQWGVSRDFAFEIIRLVEAEGFHVNFYHDDRIYVKENNENARYYQSIASVPLEIIDDLTEYLKQIQDEPTKLTVINREGLLPGLQAKLLEKYAGELSILRSRFEFLEITHKEATKGRALKFLTEKENISLSDVIAIGDNYNDVDMLQCAGLGVAMGNAPLNVQKEADFVTGTNKEDGVAQFLEKHIL